MKKFLLATVALLMCFMIVSTAMASSNSSKSLASLTKQIAKSCTTPSMSQFEKAIALYDWLIDHTVYKGSTTNPYYVLKSGEASCGGYASAYRELLSAVGIKSKAISGDFLAMGGHSWNIVCLSGKWYHVDARMGDHLAEGNGRYRWFGMSNEQARLYYRFKGVTANSYAFNYAYRTGALESSTKYVGDAIEAHSESGDKFFMIELTASGVPSALRDVFNRITVKNALQNHLCTYPGIPVSDKAKAVISLQDDLLIVNMKVPTYRIKTLTRTVPMNTEILVDKGTDFSTVEKLEFGDKVLISPSYATQKTLYWKSDREKVAIVNQSGEVRIVGLGTAKIKALATDGSKLTSVFIVTVKQKVS